MCDCFHLAFPNWHAASSGTGAGRRLRGPEPGAEDDSVCDEPSQFTEGERPRPQGSSPVEEYPETGKYTDSDKECEAEHDTHHESGSGKKSKKSGLGSMFEKRSTPKMSKLKEVPSPESGVIVKTAKDGCAEGLIYGGGGREGIFIKEVVPESPASKSLKLKEGDRILSATVYFDNMSYEDAIQILEHAQAYKVKLCLKRKPDITETEPAIESDIIPEEDLGAPEMREQGKTKRRGDARISWPKFPSFGKGRKSRFTRSHSSSEADEQRKLELSPTTSDTESPIKSQDALKGKKKHKMKLSALKKKGRTSSSEDQETPTTGQISGKIVETHDTSDMLSPECLESPSGETPEVYVTEKVKVVEDLRLEQNDQKLTELQSGQHKVELITIDSTLKTADLTAAVGDKESSSGIKSPDGKKKKKERSELKMKILGKDKSHKKDTKAKSSPKRLKTLGASIEIQDQPANEKTDIIQSFESHTKLQGDQLAPSTTQIELSVPEVELDMSDVAFMHKSPQKGEEKIKKDKEMKEKQETKTGPTFKLPEIGLSDINTEDIIQEKKVNVEEYTTKIEPLIIEGTEVKGDPYEQLSKSSFSRTQLPKREEIEIPGMEDMSKRTKAKGHKEPKAGFMGHYEAETVQLSIDVESVKEAVSKLPGYKLPKVDTSGVPIPDEITVIDANAQRISVKTPTKVVDTKTKHDTHFTNIDVTAFPEISKTTIKLPKMTPADLTSEELVTETKVDLEKTEKTHKTKTKQSDTEIKTEVYKREDIIIPGKESAHTGKKLAREDIKFTVKLGPKESDKKSKHTTTAGIKVPNIGIDLPKENISQQKEIDSIEYIDSVDDSSARKDVRITGFGVNLDAAKQNTDIFIPEIRGELKHVNAEEHTIKTSKFGAVTVDISVPDADKDINIDGAEIKTFEGDGKGSKFKMPNLDISMPKVKGSKIDSSLSKKDVDVTLPEAKAEVTLQEVPQVDITLGYVDVSKKDGDVPEAKANVKFPEEANISVDTKQLQSEAEMDVQGRKFKMPKLGITIPKVKGPAIDFSSSQKDGDLTQPETKAEVKLPDIERKEPSVKVEIKATKIEGEKDADRSSSKFKMPTIKLPKFGGADTNISDEESNKIKAIQVSEAKLKPYKEGVEADIKTPNIDIEGPSIDVTTTAAELNESGSKFKMPKFEISLPKVKGPEIDLSVSKKDVDITLPEVKAEVKLPDVELTEPGVKEKVKAPEFAVRQQDVEGSPSKYKMATFKLPKFGVGTPNKDAKIDGDDIKIPEQEFAVNIAAPIVDTESPLIDIKTTGTEQDEKGSKFKMPHLGFTMPKMKGPKIDLSLSKKDIDVKLPETKVDLPGVDLDKVDISIPEAKMEVKNPALDMQSLQIEGELDEERERFKMPKFGMKMPKVKVPEFDLSLSKKDVDVTLPRTELEDKLQEAQIKLPVAPKIDINLEKVDVSTSDAKMEVKKPELEMKPFQSEGKNDRQGSKFQMPKFGMSVSKVEGPEIDIRSSKKDVNIIIPEAKADFNLPDVELKDTSAKMEITAPKIEAQLRSEKGSPSKFKMPTFKFPKFGVTTANVGISVPKVKGPEIDLSIPKKDVDVALPEVKVEGKLPDMELKEPSAEVEIKAPEIEATTRDFEGSQSKLKTPLMTFNLPKLGIGTPSTTVQVPSIDKDVKLDGGDMKIPEEILTVDIAAPSIDAEGPSIDIKTTGTEHEAKGTKFKMPSLGFSVPEVKKPDIKVSLPKKDVDVKLPEAKTEVQLPDVKLEGPSAKVEITASGIDVQTGNVEGSPSKFKMPTLKLPKFGAATPPVSVEVPDVDKDLKVDGADLKLPQIKGEVSLPDVEIKEPVGSISVSQASMTEGDAKLKKTRFSLPKFSFSKQSTKELEVDVSLPEADVSLPEANVDVKKTEVELKPSEGGVEFDGQGSKFKIPKFGISMPKVKGPEIDLSLSKKDVDVALPEAKAEVKLPDVKIKGMSSKVEIKAPEIETQVGVVEGSPSKLKMPTLTLPKFGAGTPEVTVEVPDVDKDIKIDEAKLKLPKKGVTVDVTAPSIDTDGISIDVKGKGSELEGSGSKFKMPKFGISVPKVKGPEIDLSISKKDVDVKVSEVKAEAKLPDVELKEPSAEVEMKAPKIKVATKNTEGSPSRFKLPTFSLPKFGVGAPSVAAEVPNIDKDVKLDGGDIKFPEEVLTVDTAAPSIDVQGPSMDIKTTGTEHEAKGTKFKMPSLGFSVPEVKKPDIDLSLSKTHVDVTLPEAKTEVQLPDVKLEGPSAKVEITASGIDVQTGNVEGSPSRFKMPTLKLPKFGAATPSVSVEVPDVDKDLKVDGADLKLPQIKGEVSLPDVEIKEPVGSISVSQASMTEGDAKLKKTRFSLPKFSFSKQSTKELEVDVSLPEADVSLPEVNVDVKKTEVELKPSEGGVEFDGQGSKFKIPKFGISMPKVKGPEIDLSLSKKDVDVALPEAKAEVKLPDVKIKGMSSKVEIKAPEIETQVGVVEGSPSKLKMPTLTLPKFGAGTPEVTVEVPDVDKDIKIDEAKLKLPKKGVTVDVTAPSIDTDGISIDVKGKGSELEGSGSKFKMPKFGISVPKVKGPEIDLSISKKDVDVKVSEVKAEAKLPDVELKEPSAEVEMKAPKIKVATKNTEGSPSRFKLPTFSLPKFGVGAPSVAAEVPNIDKDVKLDGGDIKFPEEVLTVDTAAPSIDVQGPSMDIKTTGTEHEAKGTKFKMPSLGFSVPEVKKPDIDLSLSKTHVDVTLPEAKTEVQLPDVKLEGPSAKVEITASGIDVQTGNVEGSPSRFKMPTLKLPKFGAATPSVSVEVPDVDKDLKVDGADLKLPQIKGEVSLPDVEIKEPVGSISVSQASMTEGDAKLKKTRFSLPKFSFSKQSTKELEVDVSLPEADVSLPEVNVDVKKTEVELKPSEGGVEFDGQGSKFKIPKFGISMPKVKGPEIDLSLSKKDVDVALPEAKAEVKLPDVKLKEPSAEVEIKAPEIKVATKTTEGSPSKFKMPTFSFPKFGVGTPSVTTEVSETERDVKFDGGDVKIPEEVLTVETAAPSIETEAPSIVMKSTGSENEERGRKFKMPSLGFSAPQVKRPDIDQSLSKKDADVTLPEAKAEVTLPDIKLEGPSAKVEIKTPGIDVQTSNVEGSPSKFKMPTFTFPKFGGATPKVSVEVSEIKVDEAKLDLSKEGTKVDVTAPSIDTESHSVDVEVKESKLEGSSSKFKMPKFGKSVPTVKGPEIDLSISKKKDEDDTLPVAKAEVKLPNVKVKEPKDEISVPDAPSFEVEDQLKQRNWTFPKFSFSRTGGQGQATDVDVNLETPEAKAEVCVTDVNGKIVDTDGAKLKKDVTVNIKGLNIDIKTDASKVAITDAEMPKTETHSEGHVSPSKFKLPSFKMPKLSFTRPKPEDEYVPVETEDHQLEMEVEPNGETKSSKVTLTSFGEILKNIDVEFDVSNTDKEEKNPDTMKEVHETEEPSGKQLETKKKETEQDTTKSPERTGWFKFPRFGLSSPSEPVKTSEKEEHKAVRSPVGETLDDEVSPTCSVQSSDAFADISSAMTSEHVGLSLSSPTKVTVKYSDPYTDIGLGEMHRNMITSTTRTKLISVEPNLPEKITIQTSGVSSSSEDTLRLESGKIHVITSNIQATPEAQHTKLLTSVQVQSPGDFPLKSEANEAASWIVEDSQSGKRAVFERHLIRETSSERSDSKETIVITKQITRMFDSSEPISGETASSIQRLKDSVHSEKMRFFDGAEK